MRDVEGGLCVVATEVVSLEVLDSFSWLLVDGLEEEEEEVEAGVNKMGRCNRDCCMTAGSWSCRRCAGGFSCVFSSFVVSCVCS